MKNLYVLTLIAFIIGCNPDDKKTLESGIDIQYIDSTINPGNDFYTYVNSGWLNTAEIPKDKTSYGTWDIVDDKKDEDVKIIIEEAANGEFAFGSDEQKVGDFYKSYLNMDKRNEIGIKPLIKEFEKIESIKTYDDLAAYFGYAAKYSFSVPFGLYIMPDFKNPDRYMALTWQSGLGLPDRDYYSRDDKRSVEIKDAYRAYVTKMFELANLPDADENAHKILALETMLASEQLEKEKIRMFAELYHMVSLDSLPSIMPDFNWDLYLKTAELPDISELCICMLDYTKALNDIIFQTDLETWKIYMKWKILQDCEDILNEEMYKQYFLFQKKELLGQEEPRPLWKEASRVMDIFIGELIGKVYVKKHFPPEAKERMTTMIDYLILAWEESINDLEWMSDSTKQEALRKLTKFSALVGYPNKWIDYSTLQIDENDLYGNCLNSSLFLWRRLVDKLDEPVDKEDWEMTPQTVNAYYSPWENQIVFPAAVLQPPFFNLQADDAANYGAIGAAIGHEIGHGFDDMGSSFDGDGAIRNWWTEEDKERFKETTSKLIDQYNEFEVLPGLYVNGEFTLGENIGDLGGLSIALKAYKLSLEGKESPVLDGLTGEQRFFMGWAQIWRTLMREETLRVQVNTDEHPPDKFRVNGVVRNIPEFYTAFNVSPEDLLYLPPGERVKIW